MPERNVPLRPWWHVGVPFSVGAAIIALIGFAGTNPLLIIASIGIALWGIVWSLLARRAVHDHIEQIAAATALLAEPTEASAVWLGPATLQVRPRKAGHLVWSVGCFIWTTSDAQSLSDTMRRVATGAISRDLTVSFADIEALRYESKVLSGDVLTLKLNGRDSYRFKLHDPATFSYLARALEENEILEFGTRPKQRSGTTSS